MEEEEGFEQTLLVVREVSVYKIPARASSGAYKCAEWLQSDKIWSGRLRMVSLKEQCRILLEDPNSAELFAACEVKAGHREASVETVADSSRYFVIRIEDGRGKHAFVGLGFAERNEAFDFNVALSDHEKYVKRESEKEGDAGTASSRQEMEFVSKPSLDLKLKEGETIRINVKTKASSGSGMLSNASSGVGSISSTERMKAPLVPPPGGGRLRSPLPPPPNDTRPPPRHANAVKNSVSPTQISSSKDATNSRGDPLADLSQLEVNLPAINSRTGPAKSTGAGWALF